MRKILAIILVALLIILVVINGYQYYRYGLLEENFPIPISELKGENQESFIGRIVTVEGYFILIANEHPILVSNIEYLFMDKPIPDDQFIELVNFTYKEYVGIAGSFVHTKGKVTEVSEDDIGLYVAKIEEIATALIPYQDVVVSKTFAWELIGVPSIDYAVLISGGINPNFAYDRYWNDMKGMYQILIDSYGYDPDNIIVIYKNGTAEDNDMPVDFSATTTNVTNVFNSLADNLTTSDSLFIFLNNHGGGFWSDDPDKIYLYGGVVDLDGDEPESGYSESTYGIDINWDGDELDTVRIDETLWLYNNQIISDDDMANLIDDIDCDHMIIFMKQCFSGGFIHDLSGQNRIILSSCGEEEPSWGHPPGYNHGEFSLHFMLVVSGWDWTADVNNDGRISMVEAFNYASNEDVQPETPHYDDNGDGIGHAAPIPNGGDGSAGANAFL